MKTQNQCLRKLEYYIISIKKDILNRNVRLLKSMFISMHSILGLASFCMNYCINAAWHGDNQPVALFRCNGSPGCFDSGLQVICIVGSGVSHHRFSMGFKNTVENTVDQHQQMIWQPKSSLTVETSHWTLSKIDSVPLHSSSRLWDLDFQMKCKMFFHLKRGLWTTEQQSSYFSP